MAHMLESAQSMVYTRVGGVPWHGLGVPIEDDLTPVQVLEKAGLNWEVEKIPGFFIDRNEKKELGWSALVRSSDRKFLDRVPNEWKPVQNQKAFEFFNDWIAAGEMSMETAGSLMGGKMVWALAKIKELSFAMFGDRDVTDSYLLFVNPHRYGFTTSVSLTSIRAVCWNTVNQALEGVKKDKIIRVNHRQEFDPDEVKETLGVAKAKIAEYKRAAEFLSAKRYDKENVVEFFKRIFPMTSNKSDDETKMSKTATNCYDLLETQPGAEFAPGTWWNAFNAVTYVTDHKHGRDADSRLSSSWFGEHRKKKMNALNWSLEFANAA